MATLTELTAQIVTARATKKDMTTEELQAEMKMIFSFLKGVEEGGESANAPAEGSAPVKVNYKHFFKKTEVICMVCNKGGFKTLKRHLSMAHNLKPGEYRKQFGIPSTQSLVAKAYSEQRKKDALDRGQGEILAKARAVRAAKNAKPVAVVAPVAPVVKAKAAAVKAKPAATAKPAVAAKAPAKKTAAAKKKAPAKA